MKDGMTASALRRQYAAETANGAGCIWDERIQLLEGGKAKKSGGNKTVLALLLALVLTLVGSAAFFLIISRGGGGETASVQSEKAGEKEEQTEEERPARKDLFDENGVQTGYFTYEYDEEGRCIRQEELGMDGVSKRLWEHTYSADGRECETLFYWQGEFSLTMMTYYDENGVRTEEHTYDVTDALFEIAYCDGEGEFIRKEGYQGGAGAEWKYVEEVLDERGYAVEARYFTESGEVEFSHVTEYDDRGNITRDVSRHGDGSFFYERRCAYDENDLLVRDETYDENGTLKEYTVMEYRSDGQIEYQGWYDGENMLQRYTVTEYGGDGRPVAEQEYDGNDEQTGYAEYIYAEDGSYDMVSYGMDGTEQYRMSFDADGFYIG